MYRAPVGCEELKEGMEKAEITYTRDICRVLESLIEKFKSIPPHEWMGYKKIVVPSRTDMRKVWPIIELTRTAEIDMNVSRIFDTKYTDDYNQYDVYGVVYGERDHKFDTEDAMEMAIKRLLLEHYKPENMPDSDTFLDNYPKHLAENRSHSTSPPVVLWYELLLKLAPEPGSFIEITPLDGPLKPLDFPCTVLRQTIKNDVCEASVAALEHLFDKAGCRQEQAETEQDIKPVKELQAENVFKKTGDSWTVRFQENTASIKDSRGMAYIACLLAKSDKPIAALTLANLKIDTKLMTQGKVVENDAVSNDSGKPQDLVDKDYLTECNQRLHEIEEELRKAEKNNDPAEKDRLERERGQIRDLLKPALNLSGKSRSFSDDVQKARVAVSMAIIRALKNINEHHSSLYRHLDNSIQRGTDFAYQPEKKISWQLSKN